MFDYLGSSDTILKVDTLRMIQTHFRWNFW
jgi:hypothetical protein